MSADAKWLAAADANGVVAVTDVEKGKAVFRDDQLAENTVVLSFSKDARRLGGVTSKGAVRAWEAQSGALTVRFEVYDLSNATRRQTISIDRSRVTATAFAPGAEQMVVAAADGTMRLVELDEQKTHRALANYPFAVWTMTFDDEGRLAAGSWDGTVSSCMWEGADNDLSCGIWNPRNDAAQDRFIRPYDVLPIRLMARYWPPGAMIRSWSSHRRATARFVTDLPDIPVPCQPSFSLKMGKRSSADAIVDS